jgi:hypothetical protein
MIPQRIVGQFSCGAASATAIKIAIQDYLPKDLDIHVVNAYIEEEHEDNRRFLIDCERWFGVPIVVLKDTKYSASTREVWRRKRYIKGRYGAPCSLELKRKLLKEYAQPGDLHILGYTADRADRDRWDKYLDANPDIQAKAPLIELNLKKSDCLALVERAGIELPYMYRLGYKNANCIGCIKGGEGYWNKIRRDFPERFYEIAHIEQDIGPGAYLFRNRKTGVRFGLNDLKPNAGRYDDEPDIACSAYCELVELEELRDDEVDGG